MALALGCLPSELDEAPARDIDLLAIYWELEPWGQWRDNLHAAIVAREIRASAMSKGEVPPIKNWMLITRQEHVADVKQQRAKFFDRFRQMAKAVKRKVKVDKHG